jgi:hypothetical protein
MPVQNQANTPQDGSLQKRGPHQDRPVNSMNRVGIFYYGYYPAINEPSVSAHFSTPATVSACQRSPLAVGMPLAFISVALAYSCLHSSSRSV